MSPHQAQFSSLPWELRTQIYDLALDRTPRFVEVEVRDRTVVSKTRPPALLHVHRESREFVLEIYKPWLPQFAGRAAHAPYAALLARYRPSKTLENNAVSCLHDVCFDMERDILVCRPASKWSMTRRPLYWFGRIEECCLRKLAVNIEGWLKFPLVVQELRKAKNLDILYLFQDVPSDGMHYKLERISDGLKRSAEKDRLKPKVRVPNYVAPSIRMVATSQVIASWVPIPKPRKQSRRGRHLTPPVELVHKPRRPSPTWTTYKYPARSSQSPARPFMEVQINPTQKPSSRKRKAETDPEAASTDEPRLLERAKRIKLWTKARERRKKILDPHTHPAPGPSFDPASMKSEWTGSISQFSKKAAPSTTEASSRPRPRSEASSSRHSHGPPSDTESVLGESAESEEEDSEPSDSESEGSGSESPDIQDAVEASTERTPRQLHAHRFNFDIGATELLVEFEDSPDMDSWEWLPKDRLLLDIPILIAAFMSNNPPLEAETPVRFHERNSGSVGFDFLVEFEGYPEEIYWTWVPESNMQARVPHMVDEWMSENASNFEAGGDEESVHEQILAEQNYAKNIGTDEVEDIDADESAEVAAAVDADAEDADAEEADTEEADTKEADTEEADTKEADTKEADTKEADTKEADTKEADTEEAHTKGADTKEADVEDAGDEESSAEYTPKRFVAQRETPDGREILVEWEGYPDEKDWTWEPESNLLEDTPNMVKAWKSSRKAKKVSNVYEVDSILGKRKVRGEWHYVVKWKGFSKDEATSLEPCEKLGVDVPDLVEAFENRKPKRGRPKKMSTE